LGYFYETRKRLKYRVDCPEWPENVKRIKSMFKAKVEEKYICLTLITLIINVNLNKCNFFVLKGQSSEILIPFFDLNE
jgi:hypothetical protein